MCNLESLIRHEELVTKVFDRLRKGHKYDYLEMHVLYQTKPNRVAGECDIISRRGNTVHYYEIKGTDHPNGYQRALAQFRRYKWNNPLMETKFIYIGGNKVRRIRL
jgi:Holliday junction resolvase-like predicted endonuclease